MSYNSFTHQRGNKDYFMRHLKIKAGMKGSNCGKGRTMKTGMLKHISKKARRTEAKKETVNF